ncbi:MAG: imidazole glycerol phosphate synthase subunit HisH, partial [Proteobacteria bacterium]|nr:imidazole glycerol phosphate synthase subunit HisH [Pseudomonadota bacterium]
FNLIEPIKQVALSKPFLGICLGLQLLFEESEEYGPVKGLSIFPGKVKRFSENMIYEGEKLKVPHMGWSEVRKIKDTPYLNGINDNSFFYFVHSYYVETDESLVATKTFYGIDFVSSISYGKLFACQFHPEKSQRLGLKILKNFSEIVEKKDR